MGVGYLLKKSKMMHSFACRSEIFLYVCAKWQFNIDGMNIEENVLHYCGDCINKVVDGRLPKGSYRCHLVARIIGTDVVHYDTDATDCVRNGWYQRVSDANNGN